MATLRGYGCLQPGDRQYALSDAQIKAVDFVVLRDRWSYLEPKKGQYDFSVLLAQMKRCQKLKKPFTISVMTGEDCNPEYLVKNEPWNLDNIRRYELLHVNLYNQMLGQGLAAPYTFNAVWITGPTVPSQEMHLKGAQKLPGFSNYKMVEAWKAAIDAIVKIYGNFDVTLILSISGETAVKPYLDVVIDYLKSKALLTSGKGIAFQHNSLGTQTNVNANHHKKLLELHKQGYRVGAEMVAGGHTAAIKKFPEASFIVLYPDDLAKIKSLPTRPKN